MTGIKKYASLFRIRFQNGMQYRAAALAGVVTQFAWGGMSILLYHAFYRANPAAFPMELSALSSYIWLQQAFLALFMTWFMDNDIFALITSGNVAYELCRPIGLYSHWFVKSAANRVSRAVLRCLPILLVAAFLPEPYGISLPPDGRAALLFLPALVLGTLVVVAFCMLVYIGTFFTMSPQGLRIVAVSAVEFFSGAIVPLPFLPDGVRKVFELLPFGSMQNLPLRIYSGDIAGAAALGGLALQLFWLAVLVIAGRLLLKKALARIVVQGG